MQVEIEVKVRDAVEVKFIEDVTAAVEAFVIKHNRPDIKRLCFARKSSYAGVRAADYHLRAKRTDHNDKELWVNIKECSTSLETLFNYVARALYWWDCKDKAISKKTVSEAQYVTAMLGVTAPIVATVVTEPVARVQAAAQKKRKVLNRETVAGCEFAIAPVVKKTENAFLNRFAEVVKCAAAETAAAKKVHRVDISKWKKSVRFNFKPDASGVEFRWGPGTRSMGFGTPSTEFNSISVSFIEFNDVTFGLAVAKVILSLQFKLTEADKPDAVDLLANVLRDGSHTEAQHKMAMIGNNYARRVLGE